MPCAAGPCCSPATSPDTLPGSLAAERAGWAVAARFTEADSELARRALLDTLAAAAAARDDPFASLADELGDAGRLAVLAHLRDYDDLHLPSTSHVSAVCVPAALAFGG